MISFLDSHLCINECRDTRSITTFDKNIIKPDVYQSLDHLINKYNTNETNFKLIYTYFNSIAEIKIHETEKSGFSLQITKKRETILKNALGKLETIDIKPDLRIQVKDIKFTKSSTTTNDIEFPLLNKICEELLILKDNINSEIVIAYNDILKKLEIEWFDRLENISKYISKLDVILCKAYIANKYNYFFVCSNKKLK